MAELGWAYDVTINGFRKGGMVVTFDDAESAFSAALRGIDRSVPANDVEVGDAA
jgi:hypothetical protein